MNSIQRRKEIFTQLEQNQTVYISEISQILNVSAMTIRRDLNRLADQGLVTLIRGGAALNRGAALEYSSRFRKSQYPEEKYRIAKYCANLVTEGSSVFIDCGTTAEKIAEMLVMKKNIMAMTMSLPAANILSTAKDLRFIMAPGLFHEKPLGFMGQLTSDFISRFKIDILFLGANGLDLVHGATTPDLIDAETKQSLVQQAEKVVLATSHTKFGLSYFMRIAALKDIDLIVTDKAADPKLVQEMRDAGVDIVLV
jgi:DeoR/GlpR family transcriptional regulator of sugar metabolism